MPPMSGPYTSSLELKNEKTSTQTQDRFLFLSLSLSVPTSISRTGLGLTKLTCFSSRSPMPLLIAEGRPRWGGNGRSFAVPLYSVSVAEVARVEGVLGSSSWISNSGSASSSSSDTELDNEGL